MCTDLTTATYSRLYFNNFCDPLIDKYSKKNKYDLYLLLDIDIPWVKDGLRDRPNDRKLFLENFKEALIKNKKTFKLISGNFKERLKKSINFVDDILLGKLEKSYCLFFAFTFLLNYCSLV